jgi:6-methylsalicylate decarboxylase
MTIDVHQHLWPPPLVEALRRRAGPPRLSGWTLELAGEPALRIDPRQHDPSIRAAEASTDGLELALVSLSSPLGIEHLPSAEARGLLEAYHDGLHELPPPFRGWAATCIGDADPSALERELGRGCIGLQLPATALVDERDFDHLRALLDLLQDSGRPLFIHPGPARAVPGDAPAWWPAIVSYVQQMHAVWFAFGLHGRRRHRRLRVCFALLAGLAPLHEERFAARAGERTAIDQSTFVEISSYGTRAVDATVRVLGIDPLLNGSDRPYAEPAVLELGDAALSALRNSNPMRFLDLEEHSSDPAVTAGRRFSGR